MSIFHSSIPIINTFSRPSTPKMIELQQFALNKARVGKDENDVFDQTSAKAQELGKKAPTQLEIRKVLAKDLETRYPGIQASFPEIPITSQVPLVAPKAKSKRTASEAEIEDPLGRASVKSDQIDFKKLRRNAGGATGGPAAAANRRQNDDPVLRSFSPFSKENLDKLPADAIKAFNESRRPESPKLEVGTSNYEKAKQRHQSQRKKAKRV